MSNKKQFLVAFTLVIVGSVYTLVTHIEPAVKITRHYSAYATSYRPQALDSYEFKKPSTASSPNYYIKQIDGQNLFIFPSKIRTETSKIVIYSHGSETEVTADFNEKFMKQLIEYGNYYSSNGFTFVASNEHTQAYGNKDAVTDIVKAIQFTKTNTDKSPSEIYLLGYSMGGLSTMHYAMQYPDNVKSIVLLAPTIRQYEWTDTQFKQLKNNNIPIRIYHGNQDINVDPNNTLLWANRAKEYGIDVKYISLTGVNHWNIENEYDDEIVEIFKEN